MRLILRFFIGVLLSFTAFGQTSTVYFADALKAHLKKYNAQSDLEFEKGDVAGGQALFDSLVKNYLVGSRFTDYSLKSVNSGKIKLSEIKKPVYLITYASWCVMNRGEAQAINKLSRQYAKKMEFVVLFWDKKSEAKKYGQWFRTGIKVCYANESYRNDANVVATLKHTLGFPTSYFLNTDLDVVDIRRGGIPDDPKMTARQAFARNYDLFNQRITEWLAVKDQLPQQLANSD